MAARRVPSSLWSAADVIVQRGAAAAAVMLLALLADPTAVGYVSVATLLLTLYQALFEAPVRQSGYRALSTGPRGLAALTRLVRLGGVLGSLGLVCSILVFLLLADSGESNYVLVGYGVVPLIVALYLPFLVLEQGRGRWAVMARRRAIAASFGGICSIPFFVLGYPISGIVVLTVGSELMFLIQTLLLSRFVSVSYGQSRSSFSADAYKRDVRATSILSTFGWMRGQLDRVSIVALAGPALLGSFTFAYAIARAPADAALSGLSNLFRSELSNVSQDASEFRAALHRHYGRLIALCTAGFIVAVISVFILFGIMNVAEWGSSLAVVPLLAASTFSSAFEWSINALLNHVGLSKRVYIVQWCEVGISLLVGLIMLQSLVLGVVIVLVREFLGAALTSYVARAYITRGMVWRWMSATLVSVGVSTALWFYLASMPSW